MHVRDSVFSLVPVALVLFDVDETLMSTATLAEARHSKNPLDLTTLDSYANVRLHDGVADALRRISTAAAVGLVSSSARWYVDQLITDHLPGAEFSVTVTYDDVERIKPDPEPLLLALRKTGYDTNQAVYIGDADVDHAACVAAGIRFVGAGWVDCPTFPSTALSLASPGDLLGLLEGVGK